MAWPHSGKTRAWCLDRVRRDAPFEVARECEAETGISVHPETIRRWAKGAGIDYAKGRGNRHGPRTRAAALEALKDYPTCSQASRALAMQGMTVSYRTLVKWRDDAGMSRNVGRSQLHPADLLRLRRALRELHRTGGRVRYQRIADAQGMSRCQVKYYALKWGLNPGGPRSPKHG